MSPKQMQFLASGNIPAALYVARRERRRRSYRIESKSSWDVLSKSEVEKDQDYTCISEPYIEVVPSFVEALDIVKWLRSASSEELETCRVGLVSDGFDPLVVWVKSVVVTRSLGHDKITFSGKYDLLPEGMTFVRMVLHMASGEQISWRQLDLPLTIRENHVSGVFVNFTTRIW